MSLRSALRIPVCFAALLTACAVPQTLAQPAVHSAPSHATVPAKVPAAVAIVFENIIRQSKVDFTLRSSISPHRYSIETMTGGVAVFDYDNDGFLDLFFINGATIPGLEKSGANFSNRLFRNNGDGTLTDVTETARVARYRY